MSKVWRPCLFDGAPSSGFREREVSNCAYPVNAGHSSCGGNGLLPDMFRAPSAPSRPSIYFIVRTERITRGIEGQMTSQSKVFGTCCKDMKDALTLPAQKFLFVQEDTGVLYVTVGSVETDQGSGWFDQAVLFCPFCGTQLQTPDEIKLAAT
jgi:hypothetical protein